MKRILLLFLVLISTVSFGQRYFYSRATIGGSSTYQQILDSDVPSNFLRSGANNTITGTTALNGGGTADLRLGQVGNEINDLTIRVNNSFSINGLASSTFSINSVGDFNIGMSGNSQISIGGSTGTNGYVLTTGGTYVSWQPASGGSWGSITGTLSDQTDLQAELDDKQPLDGDLTAIAALTGTSVIPHRTGTDTWEMLSETGTGNVVLSASPTLTGSPIAPTQSTGDNSTKIATTAYVDQYTVLSNGQIPVGNASNQAVGRTPSGVISMSNTGVFSFATAPWLVTGTSTLTGATTIAGAFNLNFTNARTDWNSTYTAAANNDYGFRKTGTFTMRSTASETFSSVLINPTIISGSSNQTGVILDVSGTFTPTGGAFSNALLARITGSSGTVIVNSTGALSTTRGLSFNSGLSAGSNVIDFAASTGTLSGYTQLSFAAGSSTSQSRRFLFSGTFNPTSGAVSNNLTEFAQTINQTGGANGSTGNVVISTVPTAIVGAHKQLVFNTSSTANPTNPFTSISIEPTVGTGTFYGLVVPSTSILNGFGTATPTSTFEVAGSFETGYVAKTGAYTLTVNDHTVEVTSGTHTQTLPTAVGIAGRIYVITNSGSGTVTVGTTSSQTFVNVTATPTTLTLNQFQTVTVQSNGANWLRLSTL